MMNRQDHGRPEVSRPHGAGPSPQSRRVASTCAAAVALLGVTGVLACESGEDAQVGGPVVLALGAKEAPSYSDGELTLYESQAPVPFPVRKPTAADMAALKGAPAPYPHMPFLLDGDENVEVNFTLTNLDNQSHAVILLIDPWNEFVRYKPGVTVVSDDETEPNLSGIQQPYILGPKERIEGNLNSVQMSTLALKLDTAMAIMAATLPMDAAFGQSTLLNHDFNIENTPGPADPLLAKYTPKIVAGLTGFDLGLQSYEPLNVAIELTVTVLDNGTGKILAPGTTGALIGPPPAFLKIPGSK